MTLFLTYWELNEDMSVEERQQVAGKLTSSGLFPPKGVNIIRWDSTPDGWGIIVAEAQTAADIVEQRYRELKSHVAGWLFNSLTKSGGF